MINKKIKSFTDLDTWKEGHKLVLLIYESTKFSPKEERFALTDQIRRAAVSITSNIAEGFSRQSLREKIQFYSISKGSNTEVQNQSIIAKDLKYLDQEKFLELIQQSIRVSKLLSGLIKYCKNNI